MVSAGTKPILTVGEALKRPLFAHARVAAGSRGLARPIRWVHVLEAADNASFLKGGELILSTGVGFSRETQRHLLYLEEVIRRKAAGLCIELGSYIPHIPPDMAELANHHGFPLIAFHKKVHFVDITMDLHEHLINLHNKALRQLEDYSRNLQKLTLKTQSLPRILLQFQNLTHSQAFLYSLDQNSLYAPNMPQTVQQEMKEVMDAQLLSQESLPQTHGILSISPRKKLLYQPIVAMGNILAYLCLITYEEKGDEFLYLSLDYTAGAIAQILLRVMFARERAFSNESRLMEDILQGSTGSPGRLQEVLGSHKTGEKAICWAAVMQVGNEEDDIPSAGREAYPPVLDYLAIFRAILSRRGFRSLMYSQGDRLYLLLLTLSSRVRGQEQLLGQEAVTEALEELKKSCREALGSQNTLNFGVSSSSPDYAGLRRAFTEAEQVLALGKESSSPFFSDLGVYRLFLLHQDQEALAAFADDYLGPLVEHDRQHPTHLLLTLRTYLEQGCNKQETAEKLFIHRQTLYHRLGKIAAVLGENYLYPQNRLSLEMAFRIRDWLNQS